MDAMVLAVPQQRELPLAPLEVALNLGNSDRSLDGGVCTQLPADAAHHRRNPGEESQLEFVRLNVDVERRGHVLRTLRQRRIGKVKARITFDLQRPSAGRHVREEIRSSGSVRVLELRLSHSDALGGELADLRAEV